MTVAWPGREIAPASTSPSYGTPGIFTIPDPVGAAEQDRAERSLQIQERREARAAAQDALTPAQKAIDSNFAKEYVEWAVSGGRADYEKGRNQLQDAINALRSGDRITGGIIGRLPDFANEIFNPQSIPTREAVEEVVQRNLRLILGAQFTEKEGERLIARAYNPRLPEAENAKRVERLLRQIDMAAEAKESAARFYEENGTLVGWGGQLPTSSDFEALDLSRDVPVEGTRTPEMRGGVPVGTEIEFNAERMGEGGFSREAALRDNFGIDRNQEAAITAFWNANRLNDGLTTDGVRQFYASIGAGIPSDEEIARGIEAAQAGAQFTGFDLTAAEEDWRRRIEEEAAQRGQMGAIDLAGHGLQAGLGDEAAGVGGAVAALLTGGDAGEAYRFENELRDYQLEQARDQNGWLGTAAEVIGNAATGGWASNIPSTTRAAVREGMIAGAVPGFGYGEGAGESVAGAGLGAAAGGIISRAFAGRTPPPPTGGRPGNHVVQAADDLNAQLGTNIRPLPADVGGPMTRRATGAAAQLPFGAAPITKAAQAVNREGEAARNAIAAKVGTPQEIEIAGQQALRGAQKWMRSTGAKVNTLYARARKLSDGVAVPLTNARRALDQHIAELESTPGGATGVTDLRALREELSEDYTIDAIKRMRTTLRDRFVGDGIRKTDIERRVGQIVDAAEQDVVDGLVAAGRPEAATAWANAAAEARKRLQVIDNVLAPILGKRADAPKSGEQIMRAISTMSKTDNAKLAQFIKALPAEEAGTLRATVIGRLGTTNADASDFTLTKFLTQWEKMTPGAKRTLFGGELTEALDKLGTVASGAKEAQRFANFSNTGSVVGMVGTGVGLTGFTAAPVAVTAALAGQYALGRLLASPAFARWLARMPKNPQAAKKHNEALSRIASSETAIAADALGLQRQLNQFFEGGSGRLAVEPLPLAAQEPEPSGASRSEGQASQ